MKLKHLLFYCLLITISSCGLFQKAMAPKFDANAEAMTQTLNQVTDDFYSLISSSSDKKYSTYKPGYNDVHNRIRALAVYDSARKHSTALLIIVHDLESRFNTYDAEHAKYSSLNNSQILAYKEGMDALLDVLFRTEANYKP